MTARFVARVAKLDSRFKVKALSSALMVVSAALAMPAYALVEIAESDLGEATAEGVAFLPENTALIFRGAGTTMNASGVVTDALGTTTESTATILSDRTKDTGYIRYIPVGPLTATATGDAIYGTTTGKADLFLYGLAISRGDGDPNSRLSATNPLIASWGTADNPWVLKVQTDSSVSNFSNTACTGAGDTLCQVSYLALEAPLYHLTEPTTPATGSDAYNLKVAFWADALVRKPSVVENMGATGTQFDVFAAGRANRLRLQAVMDGISVNGTRIQLFQTLNGAVSGATGGSANDTFYNDTLGLAGVLRINSGDTQAATGFKAVAAAGSVVRATSVTNRYSTTFQNEPGAAAATADQQYRLRSTNTVDTITTGTWTLPSNLPVVRFSTQECGAGSMSGCAGTPQGLLETPAIGSLAGGGLAPTFDSQEGVFLYGLNANAVYGSLAQPLIVGKETGTNNLVFELTRIPNKVEFYKGIYTRYAGDPVATVDPTVTYTGSTCNVYQCGSTISVNGTPTYQGNTATHGSVSIGSTVYSGTTASGGTNLLTAYKGADAIGVSFGALSNQAATVTTNYYYDLAYQRRDKQGTNQWTYWTNTSGGRSLGTNLCGTNCNEFDKAVWISTANFFQSVPATLYQQYMPNLNHTAYFVPGRTAAAGFADGASCTPAPCTPSTTSGQEQAWGMLPGASITTNAGVQNQWNSNLPPALPATPGAPSSPLNNFGSAVIDGMLIQHLKITTKGL